MTRAYHAQARRVNQIAACDFNEFLFRLDNTTVGVDWLLGITEVTASCSRGISDHVRAQLQSGHNYHKRTFSTLQMCVRYSHYDGNISGVRPAVGGREREREGRERERKRERERERDPLWAQSSEEKKLTAQEQTKILKDVIEDCV